jgi:hypothetical protein
LDTLKTAHSPSTAQAIPQLPALCKLQQRSAAEEGEAGWSPCQQAEGESLQASRQASQLLLKYCNIGSAGSKQVKVEYSWALATLREGNRMQAFRT